MDVIETGPTVCDVSTTQLEPEPDRILVPPVTPAPATTCPAPMTPVAPEMVSVVPEIVPVKEARMRSDLNSRKPLPTLWQMLLAIRRFRPVPPNQSIAS